MNKTRLAGLVLTLMISFGLSTSAQITTKTVKFPAGASSTSLKGQIKGGTIIDYVLDAKAGQEMKVHLTTGNNANYFNVLPPGSNDVAIFIGSTEGNEFSGTLSADGKYKVRVYLMRSAARRNEVANFTLDISITGGEEKAGDAKVKGTKYHATGKIRGSIDGGSSAGSSADFGVVRMQNGDAVVDATFPGRATRSFKFSRGEWTCSSPGCSLKFNRIGSDEWELIVNNSEHYMIPDAVITGG